MSAQRTTLFKCDTCGREKLSPSNYEMPEGWEYTNPAHGPSEHKCQACVVGETILVIGGEKDEEQFAHAVDRTHSSVHMAANMLRRDDTSVRQEAAEALLNDWGELIESIAI
jgi:hypothetical protein